MFTGIIGALIGGFPSLLKAGLDYFTTKNNADVQKLQAAVGADRDVAIATLQAQVAANQAKAGLLQSQRFTFLLFFLYSPLLLHAAVIALGRMHFVAWDAMPLDAWELDVLRSLYITAPAVSAIGGFTSWLHK